MVKTLNLELHPTSPFDFDLSAGIFSSGDAQIQRYEDGRYWRVLRVNNQLILIVIQDAGSVFRPKLVADLRSNVEISSEDVMNIEEVICSLFNLNLDLNPFYDETENDDILRKITRRLRGLRSPATPTVFEALVKTIIEQQISLHVAHKLEGNVIKRFGDVLRLHGRAYYAFPTPSNLASARIEQLRGCGLSYRKSEYTQEIAILVETKRLDLERMRNIGDSNSIIAELDRVRGIGVWTAELTMIRGMHRFDVIPADDLGLRRCVSHYYFNDENITGVEVRRTARNWGRWKGLASYYLIMANRLGIGV